VVQSTNVSFDKAHCVLSEDGSRIAMKMMWMTVVAKSIFRASVDALLRILQSVLPPAQVVARAMELHLYVDPRGFLSV
jgi:hypothetical protein